MWGCLASFLDDSAEEAKPTLGPRWCLGTAVYTECSCHSYFPLRGAMKARTVTGISLRMSHHTAKAPGCGFGTLQSEAFCFLQYTLWS